MNAVALFRDNRNNADPVYGPPSYYYDMRPLCISGNFTFEAKQLLRCVGTFSSVGIYQTYLGYEVFVLRTKKTTAKGAHEIMAGHLKDNITIGITDYYNDDGIHLLSTNESGQKGGAMAGRPTFNKDTTVGNALSFNSKGTVKIEDKELNKTTLPEHFQYLYRTTRNNLFFPFIGDDADDATVKVQAEVERRTIDYEKSRNNNQPSIK